VKGKIVASVVEYLAKEIADDSDAVRVTIVEEGPDDVIAEVRAAKPDMGRLIGRRGRVAKSIRDVAQAAADEEGLRARVEFID
jgi:uncharacterized protein